MAGACIVFSGYYLFEKVPRASLHAVIPCLGIASLLLFYSMWQYSPVLPTHIKYSETPSLSLTSFLRSRAVETDSTLFIALASENYIEPIINFRASLDKWNMGKNYVVICMDTACLQAAETHDILAYDGYCINRRELGSDWHIPIARAKVMPQEILSDCSLL